MENVILIIVLIAILGGAIAYIVRAKKRGAKCIGCPAAGNCGAKKGGCTGCHGGEGCSSKDGQSSFGCHEEK